MSRVEANLDQLENLLDEMGGKYVTRVGVLGSDASQVHEDSKLTNAQLGLIQELGSETNNIPPRSFLRMPLEEKAKTLMKSLTGKTAQKLLEEGDVKKIYEVLGVAAENIAREAFNSSGYGKWLPNKLSTVKAKGSSRPLIDTGELRRSISSDVVRRNEINEN